MEDLLKSGSQWRLLWDQLQFLSSSGLQSDWSNWEETQFFLKSKKLIFPSYVTTKLSGLVKTFMIVFWEEVVRFWENWTANSNRRPKSKKIQGLHIPCAWLFQLHLTFSIKWTFTQSFIKHNSVLCTPIVIVLFQTTKFWFSQNQLLTFHQQLSYYNFH